MRYDVDYFIKKFEAIPSNLFCGDMHNGEKHCYVGHCLQNEPRALADILWENGGFSAASLVYGYVKKYKQRSLKKRILAVLYDIKAAQAVEEAKEIIIHHKNLEPCMT